MEKSRWPTSHIASSGPSRQSRRSWLRTLGMTAVGAPIAAAFGPRLFAQGRCMLTLGAAGCNTSDIKPLFAPTGWKTTALDHVVIRVADPQKEAAFYAALMGWAPRSTSDSDVVMDIGEWGTVVFAKSTAEVGANAGSGGGGRGRGGSANVSSFCFVIDRWDAKQVEAELKQRGLAPIAEHDGRGFESFRVKDPDGFDLQIANGNGHAKRRRAASSRATLTAPAPFDPTGWQTVWLDHFSFSVSNYKESASFYANLLGWTSTYDEGSQNELLIGDVGDVIIRGGNPLTPGYTPQATRSARIDHISFGISPWDTDGVKTALESRGLRAQIDTSSRHQDATGNWVADEIHTAAFKSYHTQTPNGYNLQISYVTKANRLALSNAVRPHK